MCAADDLVRSETVTVSIASIEVLVLKYPCHLLASILNDKLADVGGPKVAVILLAHLSRTCSTIYHRDAFSSLSLSLSLSHARVYYLHSLTHVSTTYSLAL